MGGTVTREGRRVTTATLQGRSAPARARTYARAPARAHTHACAPARAGGGLAATAQRWPSRMRRPALAPPKRAGQCGDGGVGPPPGGGAGSGLEMAGPGSCTGRAGEQARGLEGGGPGTQARQQSPPTCAFSRARTHTRDIGRRALGHDTRRSAVGVWRRVRAQCGQVQ